MSTSRRAPTLMLLALLAGCGGGDTAVDSTAAGNSAAAAAATSAAAAPAAPTLASLAGTWSITSTLPGTAQPVPSTMTGSADGTTWTMSLEGRPNVPLTVTMVGDSLISESAEYESVLRKGVMVTVRTAAVVTGETMSGTIRATYKTPTGPEVVNGTITGTRNP